MSGDRPDPDGARQILGNRLEDAGLSTQRFIDVRGGEKRSMNHTKHEPGSSALSGNYGTYGGGGLVDVDIDDYGEGGTNPGLEAIRELPETFTVASPHTDGELGGHYYYAVETDRAVEDFNVDAVLSRYIDDSDTTATYEAAKDDPVALAIAEVFGTPNPSPSWGEIRAVNQYVVGPGSRIEKGEDGCDKDWCDDCPPVGDDGYYRIANAAPIATIHVDELIDALQVDEEFSTDTADANRSVATNGGVDTVSPGAKGGESGPDTPSPPDGDDVQDVLDANPWIGVYLTLGADDVNHGAAGDRSKLDYAACKELAQAGVAEDDAHDLLNGSEHTKVNERGTGYWNRTWSNAADADDGDTPTGRSPAANPGANVDPDTTADMTLSPSAVQAWAGLGEDGDVSDLDDRQKAAVVWDLLLETGEFHVRVRRDNGSLWAYDGGVWKPEGERALRHAARNGVGSMNYGGNVLAELKEQARSDPRVEVEADDLGLETGYVAVENGLVDLEAAATDDDAIRELRPDDHALTRLPVEYDPSAEYDEWADYVKEWAEDGRADALQEYVGYCLHVGANPIHRALLLVGSGANGKGTFLSVVRALLGRENTTSIELQTLANEKDAVADFYGSVANIDDDLSARKLGAGLGMFKKLVAGDRVRARNLYEDGFEFDAVGKHLYAANEVPDVQVPDEDEAFWRRWLLVEFPNHYPPSQRDPDLRDRLTEPDALSGVLNWAIEGWDRLLEQGYFTGEDRHAFEKRQRWQAWGDSVDKFISDHVERDDGAENITTGDVHRRYAAWCRENDETPASQQKLTTSLKNEDLGYGTSVRVDGSVQRGFKALAITGDVPALEDTPERGTGGDTQQDSLT